MSYIGIFGAMFLATSLGGAFIQIKPVKAILETLSTYLALSVLLSVAIVIVAQIAGLK